MKYNVSEKETVTVIQKPDFKVDFKENKGNSGHKPIKFCMFTTQRSGSTWLMDLLNNNPKIKVYDELFLNMKITSKWGDPNQVGFYECQNVLPGKRPWKIINYLKNLYTYEGKYDAIGFKLMYDHLYRKPEIIVNLLSEGYKIIHLVRDNCLDVIISYAIARSNKLFCTEKEFEPGKVYLEPKLLLKELKKQDFKVNLARILTAILPNPSIYITYDNLVQNKDATLNSVFKFLDIPEVEQNIVESNLKKINTQKHWEIIANYEEVKQALKGTKFYQYLERPE
jgi:LPS sulfotransferase NodH